MRWFKHLSSAHRDEALSSLIDEFGVAGYGFYWLVLEKIADQMEAKVGEKNETSVRYSVRVWKGFLALSTQKLLKLCEFSEKAKLFSIKKDGDYISIGCDKLLKYRDEYSKKKKKTPDRLRTKSGARNRNRNRNRRKRKSKKRKRFFVFTG